MAKKNKQLKKIRKENLVKVKNKKQFNSIMDYSIVDVSPATIQVPKKYYTAKIDVDGNVDYLDKGDILIIDPSVNNVRNGGIYVFEFRGHVLVRQFEVIPFGEHKNTYYAVGKEKSKDKEYYPKDEVNILGAIVGKHVELFPSLYHNNPLYNAYVGA